MYLLSNFQFSKSNYFTLILALFPISFIAGNMIININVALIILSAFIFFGKSIFNIKFHLLDKLLFSFFFLIIITGFINDFFSIELSWKTDYATLIKSILFQRYLLLYLIVRFLVEKKIIQFKLFFTISALATLFVSFDIFYQFYFGEDVFGFKGNKKNLGGPFGDEFIAGGYLQRFSIFAFFAMPFFYSKYLGRYLKIIVPILFIIFLAAIVLSGNRMPLILFLTTIFLIVLFQKQTRKFLIPFILIFTLTIYLIFNFNERVRKNLISFYLQVSKMVVIINDRSFNYEKFPPYLKEFASFYDTWLMNKYIGGGIKNFRYYCHHRPNIEKDSKFVCNMHPHNYYLEILTEAGIIGFILISSVFLAILYNSFYKKYFSSSPLKYNNVIVPFLFLFIIEIFPIKSTGSFFTTGSASYLFFLMGVVIGLTRKYNLIENKI